MTTDAPRSDDRTFVQKFMAATDKLRAIFGPAQSSSRDHEMTKANQESLAAMQAETAAAYETVTRPDGSTYLVPKEH